MILRAPLPSAFATQIVGVAAPADGVREALAVGAEGGARTPGPAPFVTFVFLPLEDRGHVEVGEPGLPEGGVRERAPVGAPGGHDVDGVVHGHAAGVVPVVVHDVQLLRAALAAGVAVRDERDLAARDALDLRQRQDLVRELVREDARVVRPARVALRQDRLAVADRVAAWPRPSARRPSPSAFIVTSMVAPMPCQSTKFGASGLSGGMAAIRLSGTSWTMLSNLQVVAQDLGERAARLACSPRRPCAGRTRGRPKRSAGPVMSMILSGPPAGGWAPAAPGRGRSRPPATHEIAATASARGEPRASAVKSAWIVSGLFA